MTSHGATVILYVSSGAPLVAIPDVKGFTSTDAQHMLATAKFKTKIVQRFDATAAKDTVLDVSPAVGTNAAENSTITLDRLAGPPARARAATRRRLARRGARRAREDSA